MTDAPLFQPVIEPPAKKPGQMRMRDYQRAAVDAVYAEFEQQSSTLVVMPTGTGKTVVFSHVINRVEEGRVMVLAHREELIRQAAEKIHAVTGHRPDIEMADYWADQSTYHRSRVVVSSIQTQVAGSKGGRMIRFHPGDFSLVIVDEAHHAVSPSYRKVLAHYQNNPDCKVLGVTATPDRTDEEALGKVFGSVAYVYEITDAINDGYLVPIVQRSVVVDGLDFAGMHTVAGDFNRAELAAVMEYEKNLHEIADPTIRIAGDRKTLVFCASVAHAERLAEIFNRHRTDCARWVCGETPKDERQQVLRDYSAGKFQYLCNVGVFTEGFDEPSIELVALARPTKSRALYAQMVGRGTRPLPGVVDGHATAEDRREAIALSSKPVVEIVDFVGNAGKHKLVTTADLLGGNYSDEAVELAAKKQQEAGTPTDVLAGLEEAEKELEQQRKARAEQEKRQRLRGRASYSTSTVDPFDVLDIQPARERGWDKGRKPTEKMVAMLDRNGVKGADQMSFAQAKQLITTLISRSQHDWCTYKQAKLLKRYGYEPKGMRFNEAKAAIDAIAANGWKRPSGGDDGLTELEAF